MNYDLQRDEKCRRDRKKAKVVARKFESGRIDECIFGVHCVQIEKHKKVTMEVY